MVAGLAVVLFCVAVAPPAGALAPPRPGGEATLPPAIRLWPQQAPGVVGRPLGLARGAKQGAAVHRLPVLPGAFQDLAGRSKAADLQRRFTANDPDLSVRDYWLAASGGRLEVVGEVKPWRRAPQTAAHYAGDDNGMDMWAAPRNAGRFVLDVIAAHDAAGLDWGRYDDDGPDGVPNSGDDDGYVDAVIVVHAGEGGECGTPALWSHAFFLSGWGYGEYVTATPRAGGGFLKVNDYVLVPERSCTGGVIEIGVICHEYGHVLGLPDLYDTVGGRAGVGGWGLMGTGGWGGDGASPSRPSLPCAWSRLELGWSARREVRQDGPAVATAIDVRDEVLVLRDPRMPAGEAFLVENRLRRGPDGSLPGSGLLVWHVDEAVIAAGRPLNRVNAGPVPGVALCQADGLDQLGRASGGNAGDAGDPWPGSANRTVFADHTLPASDDNAGRRTDVVLRDIPAARDEAAVTVAIGVPWLDEVPPTIALLSPLGGEDWTLGVLQTISWSAADDHGVADVMLHLSRDGGLTYPVGLARDLPAAGSWTGSLGSQPGERLVLRATARDEAGNQAAVASGVFALRDRFPPSVVLQANLAEGDRLDPGHEVLVAWQSADNVGVVTVDLQLSTDDARTWQPTVLTGLAPSGEAVWTVPEQFGSPAVLRAAARDEAGNTGHDRSAAFTILGVTTSVPAATGGLLLGPCVPNPFNPRAEIALTLPGAGPVRLAVHDAAGRRLATLVDGHLPAGRHLVVWNGRDAAGRDAASGVYWVRASTPAGHRALLRVTLVR